MDITGLDKAQVLAVLYNKAKVQDMGIYRFIKGDMEIKQAQFILDNGQYDFDYLYGRVMKIDLSGNEVNTCGYNLDNGENSAEKAVNSIRWDIPENK